MRLRIEEIKSCLEVGEIKELHFCENREGEKDRNRGIKRERASSQGSSLVYLVGLLKASLRTHGKTQLTLALLMLGSLYNFHL